MDALMLRFKASKWDALREGDAKMQELFAERGKLLSAGDWTGSRYAPLAPH